MFECSKGKMTLSGGQNEAGGVLNGEGRLMGHTLYHQTDGYHHFPQFAKFGKSNIGVFKKFVI